MYKIKYSTQFKKGYKQIVKRGWEAEFLWKIVAHLINGEPLAFRYRDHPLKGRYVGCRACHVQPDWVLIYRVIQSENILLLVNTGTHSDLF
jgi:mRNA interferase YafQ